MAATRGCDLLINEEQSLSAQSPDFNALLYA